MKIFQDFVKNVSVETLLAYVKSNNPDMYEDDAEDLLEQLKEVDVMHPKAGCKALVVTEKTEETLTCDGITISCPHLAKAVSAGDKIFPSMITVGTELDAFITGLDDIMLSYLGEVLMQMCLDEGLLQIAGEIMKNSDKRHMIMAVPGIAGMFELEEQEQILKMLEGIPEEIGVTRDGRLKPLYTNTCILYLGDGDDNILKDASDIEERKAFAHRLNVTAGHV